MTKRTEIAAALEAIIDREDGLAFQRLARRLLRQTNVYLIPHSEHADLGKDATMIHRGELTVMCASLNCLWSKVRSDIEKIKKQFPGIRRVVFCTPKTVTNKKTSKWVEIAKQEFGIDLDILERTWVIDESLREENQHLIFEELGIAPGTLEPKDQLAVGEIVMLGSSYESIENVDLTCSSKWCYATWFTPPKEKDDETVYIARISPSVISPQRVGAGADPAVAVIDNKVVVAWIRLRSDEGEWIVSTSEFDFDLNYMFDHVVCEKAKNLVTRPQLIATRNTIYLMLIEEQNIDRFVIRLLNLSKGNEIVTLLNQKVLHAVLRQAEDSVYCAVDTNDSLQILSLGKLGFMPVGVIQAKAFGAERTGRWDFAVRDNVAIIVMDLIMSDWSMFTVTVNLLTGERGDVWPITYWGKFPSVDILPADGWIASWVGSPPIPLELQREGTLLKSTSLELHEHAKKKIREDSKQLLTRQLLAQGKTDEYYRCEIDDLGLVPPEAPLWLGIMNKAGQCTKTYGPLGYGRHPNFGTILRTSGRRGAVIWRRGIDEDECIVEGRPFSIK